MNSFAVSCKVKDLKTEINKNILIPDETARLVMDDMTGQLSINAAIRQAGEMYKNSCQHTDQSNVSNHTQLVNDIIPLETDIDNGEVFDTVTGNVIRDL